jgi:diguanylate cyclase (GGDEF)-like protein
MLSRLRSPGDRTQFRLHAGTVVVVGSLMIALGLCGFGASFLFEMRRDDLEQARLAATNVVTTVSSEIAKNIDLYDLSLHAVIDGLKHPEIDHVSKEIRQLILFDRATNADHLGSTRVVDETGRLILDSRTTDFPDVDLSDRDYFRVHKQNPYMGLYISRPFVNVRGVHVIGISRRLEHPDGSFAGVVAGTLRLSYFHDLFRKIALQPGSVLALTHISGTMLMRLPFNIDDVGRDVTTSPIFSKIAETQQGDFEAIGAIDGLKRHYIFHRISDYPLFLTIGLSTDEIYALWRGEAFYISGVVLVFVLTTAGLALYAARELRRRAEAEKSLAILATTDSLTGLSNRRHFDETLKREWNRAARQGTALGLAMVDADNFKAYNDRHGHQAGDTALAIIAACIANGTRGGMDIAARYGGEELAILLPGAALHDVFEVAERIRRSVENLPMSDDNKAHCPTVSIGVASLIPVEDRGCVGLVASADRALYAAKRNGRNRTEIEPGLSADHELGLVA